MHGYIPYKIRVCLATHCGRSSPMVHHCIRSAVPRCSCMSPAAYTQSHSQEPTFVAVEEPNPAQCVVGDPESITLRVVL